MFQLLVIWTLFHVHHQKDIKQDDAVRIRSESQDQTVVYVCLVAYGMIRGTKIIHENISTIIYYFHLCSFTFPHFLTSTFCS